MLRLGRLVEVGLALLRFVVFWPRSEAGGGIKSGLCLCGFVGLGAFVGARRMRGGALNGLHVLLEILQGLGLKCKFVVLRHGIGFLGIERCHGLVLLVELEEHGARFRMSVFAG